MGLRQQINKPSRTWKHGRPCMLSSWKLLGSSRWLKQPQQVLQQRRTKSEQPRSKVTWRTQARGIGNDYRRPNINIIKYLYEQNSTKTI